MCLIAYMCQGIKPLKESMVYIIEEDGKLTHRKNTEIISFPPKKKKSTIKPKKDKNSVKTPTKTRKAKFEKEQKQTKSPFFSKKKGKEKGKGKPKKLNSTKEVVHSYRDKLKIKKSQFETKESEEDFTLEEIEKPKKFDDFELNELEYEEAVLYDHRSCFRVYISLLKREHRIIFTFLVYNDYNLVPVKYSRFIFLLATDMAMNVFFFSDATMHKIYLNYGKYDFLQQIAQILYSTIISQIIEVFLCYLSMTDTHFYEIKDLALNSENKKVIQDTFDCIKKKLFSYWLITFICFLGYWYIVACFCAVYENTQIIFIKDSLMSALVSSIYPLFLYLIPSSFRVCSLKCKNNNCLYKFSDLIPFF